MEERGSKVSVFTVEMDAEAINAIVSRAHYDLVQGRVLSEFRELTVEEKREIRVVSKWIRNSELREVTKNLIRSWEFDIEH